MTNISILPGEKPLTLEQLIADHRPRHLHGDQPLLVN